MTPKGQLFLATCLFGSLTACDRTGSVLSEGSQEIQTIDGVPTVASDDPMYLACIEEAKNDSCSRLDRSTLHNSHFECGNFVALFQHCGVFGPREP